MSKMIVEYEKCLHCGCCVGACKDNAIYLNDYILEFDDELCTRCGRCVRICPVGALSMEAKG